MHIRLTGACRHIVIGLALGSCMVKVGNAQTPLTLVNRATEVRVIRFQFEGSRSFSEAALRGVIAQTHRRALHSFRSGLALLPLISKPASHPFNPLELQRDVVRLRHFYQREGFPSADIRYEVDHQSDNNVVDVRFIIGEGVPRVLTSVLFRDLDGEGGFQAEAGLNQDWAAFAEGTRKQIGKRIREDEPQQIAIRTRRWLQNRGYAHARTSARFDTTVTTNAGDVIIFVATGPLATVGQIEIEGNNAVEATALLRQLPFRVNQSFALSELDEGRAELQGLGIIRVAALDITSESELDTAVTVRVRVDETKPRLISGELGFVSQAGLAQQGQWSHRNVFGGAETFSISGLIQPGWFAFDESPDRVIRGSFNLLQPYVFHRGVSGILDASVQYRDDARDRSWEFGIGGTLIRRVGNHSSVALRYRLATRRILEYRFGDFTSGDIDLLTLLVLGSQGALDSLGTRLHSSEFTVSATLGNVDDLTNPTRGVVLRPQATLTAPGTLTSNEFGRLDLTVTAYRPVNTQFTVVGRISLGRLIPFGKSLPTSSSGGDLAFLRLSDALYTAGGTADVRGWGNRQLGPKFPDLRLTTTGGDTTLTARGYVPLGGLSRITGTAEIRAPFPSFGPRWGTHWFLDYGKLWTPDARFQQSADQFHDDRMFFAVGGGIDVLTIVGPVRLSIGYKLNPSLLDARSVDTVLALIVDGATADEIAATVPVTPLRRFHIHISLGLGL